MLSKLIIWFGQCGPNVSHSKVNSHFDLYIDHFQDLETLRKNVHEVNESITQTHKEKKMYRPCKVGCSKCFFELRKSIWRGGLIIFTKSPVWSGLLGPSKGLLTRDEEVSCNWGLEKDVNWHTFHMQEAAHHSCPTRLFFKNSRKTLNWTLLRIISIQYFLLYTGHC